VINPAVASHSAAEGPGLKSGIPEDHLTHFTVFLRDKRNKSVTTNDYNVTITDPKGSPVASHIVETNPGDYRVEYTPTDIGKYKNHITVTGNDIAGSPHEPEVIPSIDLSNTSIQGDISACISDSNFLDLDPNLLKEGETFSFKVSAKDKRGNAISGVKLDVNFVDRSGHKTPFDVTVCVTHNCLE
jgi:uncharacterized protein YfaS (alpha-2-macroglobulin family)